MSTVIHSDNAPAAIGPYVQARVHGGVVYFSGQIPLDPNSMTVVSEDITEQAHQVFKNLQAVAEAASGSLADMLKLTIYLVDLSNFAAVNEVMQQYFNEPYPARVTIEVSALPKGVQIEIDGIMAAHDSA